MGDQVRGGKLGFESPGGAAAAVAGSGGRGLQVCSAVQVTSKW